MINEEVIPIGIFDRRNKEVDNSQSLEILKLFSNITPSDINKLLDIAKGQASPQDHNEPVDKYLSLVKSIFGGNDYLSLGDSVQTRQQRYEIYDEMDASTAYISAALDILSDDATQPDDKGITLRIVSESSKVQTIVEDLFDRLEIEEKLSKWARAIAKYGDLFVKVMPNKNGDGIESVLDTIYPGSIERRDLEGKLLAFTDATGGALLTDNIYAPWEFVHFRHKGDIYRSQQSSRLANLDKGDEAYRLSSSYGQSTLKPAIKVYAQLRFVENLIILSRLTNSIRRNIFLINTGETDPNKAFDTIRNYADLLKKDVALDIEGGLYNTNKHTFSYDEDIFIPVNDTKNDVRIESVGGDINIAEQYDLEYLLNKLFAALKIPKAYLNYEQDLNARSTLIQLDIRYARSVSQLQNTLISGLMRLASIELAYQGIDPDDVDLDIQLTTVSSIDEEAKLEQKRMSIESAKVMWDMIVTMNDKLQSLEGGNPLQGGNPMQGSATPTGRGSFADLFSSEDPTQIMKQEDSPEESKSPLDLKFVTEHILSNYFKLDQNDVDRILKKSSGEGDGKTQEFTTRKRRKFANSDLRQMYPGEQNSTQFDRLKESIINSNNDETKRLFSTSEVINNE